MFNVIGDCLRMTMHDLPIPVNKRRKKGVGKVELSDVDYVPVPECGFGNFSLTLRSGLLGDFASPRPALS